MLNTPSTDAFICLLAVSGRENWTNCLGAPPHLRTPWRSINAVVIIFLPSVSRIMRDLETNI